MSASIEGFCNKCLWRFRCPFDWETIRYSHGQGLREFEARGNCARGETRYLGYWACAEYWLAERTENYIKITIKLEPDFIKKFNQERR